MHATFLAAIRQNWGDTQPLLVYADWLEERGDSRALAFRILADCRPGEFFKRLTCLDTFNGSAARNQHQVWIHAPNGSYFRSRDATPVFEELSLRITEQILVSEKQDPAQAAALLETKRRWLYGAATREEFDEASRRIEELPMPVAARVAIRNAIGWGRPFGYGNRGLDRLLDYVPAQDPLVSGSLAPRDEFGLRLCADCRWQVAEGPPSDLQTLVDLNGPLTYLRAVRYLLQTSRLLSKLHLQYHAFRSLKPANLLLGSGEVVAPFDTVQAELPADPFPEGFSTVDYSMPENALDVNDIDLRSDLYSLGCILFFLLTGRPPFSEGSMAQRLMRHLHDAPPALRSIRPDAPADLEAIYQRLMAKLPRDRYESALELCTVLEGWLSDHS